MTVIKIRQGEGMYFHIFKETPVYCSESGNWYGICKYCGVELVCHTGDSRIIPVGVYKQERMTFFGSSGSFILSLPHIKLVKHNYPGSERRLFDPSLGEGRMPNAIIQYKLCKFLSKEYEDKLGRVIRIR